MSGRQAINPFPGLRPFTQEEDYLFFGREEQTIELLKRLGQNRFVAVVGTSGSGKSSLVRCGLLSELLGGKLLQAGSTWEIAVTHPGGNPMALLAESMLEADLYDIDEDHARENLLATLSRSHFGLVEAVRQSDLPDDANFLLVVDQFEEIFRFHEAGQLQQEIANEFVSLLLEAVSQSEVPIYVVLTMRSDFIGECGQFEGLAEMVNRGEFLIPRLTREQFKRVIEGPVKVAGGQIAPRLLQRLLNDLGQQADQLPCLQHALMRTWNVWVERNDSEALDLEHYQRVGKMAEAMSMHADEIYESLDDDHQRELCRGIFQALTIQESENRGIRRPQRLKTLSQIMEVEPDELKPIIDAYRQPGVTFLMPSSDVELDDSKIIDISHESLMRVWTRLKQWVEDEAQAAGIYRRLSESSMLHDKGKAGLYRDPELGIALAWHDSKHPNQAWAARYSPGFDKAMSFLADSQQAADAEEQRIEAVRQHELEQAQQIAEIESQRAADQARSAVRLRWLVRGVGVVAILALVATIFAWFARRDAQRNAVSAERQANEAVRQRSNAEAAQQQTAQALGQAQLAKSTAELAERRSREFRYATDMQLASVLLHEEGGDVTQALARLDDHDPSQNDELSEQQDLRGFEWHYLKGLVDSRAKIYRGWERPLVDVAIAADGVIVGLDEEAWVHRYDPISRRHIGSPVQIAGDLSPAQFALSPDGQTVAIAPEYGSGEVVVLYDARTAERLSEIPFASRNGLVFTDDGRMLVTIGTVAAWWDVKTGEPIAMQVESDINRAGPVDLSADGRTFGISKLGSTSQIASVFRMNPDTSQVETLIEKYDNGGSMGPIGVTPDGRYALVTSMFQGRFAILDNETDVVVTENIAAHSGPITAIAFHPTSGEIATGSQDGAIKIWKNATEMETPARSFTGHTDPVVDLLFSKDGNRLISASKDLTVRSWELGAGSSGLLQVETGVRGFNIAVSPATGLMAIADAQISPLRLYDASTARPVRSFERAETDGRLTAVAFSPDGRLLAAGYGLSQEFSQIEIWDLDLGKRLSVLPGAKEIPGHRNDYRYMAVSSLSFSPDGKQLAAGFGFRLLFPRRMRGTYAKVWDVATSRELSRLKGHQNIISDVEYSPDGRSLATVSFDGTVRLWDPVDWELQRTLQSPDESSQLGQGRLMKASFSPDASMLAVASHERNLHVFRVDDGSLIRTLKGHANGIDGVKFSPDGRTIASAATDKSVRLWDVKTWRELTRMDLPEGTDTSTQLAFSPDGSQLLALSYGGLVRWPTAASANFASDLAETLDRWHRQGDDFPRRIRMLSDNPHLAGALEILEKKRPSEQEIHAAALAARASAAAKAHDYNLAIQCLHDLDQLPEQDPKSWLNTAALVRLAYALVTERQIQAATELLDGGSERREEDGVHHVEMLGFAHQVRPRGVFVQRITARAAAEKAGMQVGDLIEQVNGQDVTGDLGTGFAGLINVEPFESVEFLVRRSGVAEPIRITVVNEVASNDEKMTEQIQLLESLVDAEIVTAPTDAHLRELRGSIAGLWPDHNRQVAEYTAGIESAEKLPSNGDVDETLRRLHGRRADVLVDLERFDEALVDYNAAGKREELGDSSFVRYCKARGKELLDEIADWKVVVPVEMESEKGADLDLLEDQSILASGKNPPTDTYNLKFDVQLERITAIRIEALPHESLPFNGPGRGKSGNAGISSFEATWSDERQTDNEIKFQASIADHAREFPLAADGWWDTTGKTGKRIFMVRALDAPIEDAAGGTLSISMTFHPSKDWSDNNLGRFRISITGSDEAFGQSERTTEFAKRETIESDEKGVALLALAHMLGNDHDAVAELVQRHPEAVRMVGELYVEAEEHSRAVDLYSQLIEAESTDHELRAGRAAAFEGLDDWAKASEDWTRAGELTIGTGQDQIDLHHTYANRLKKANRIELAHHHYDLALRAIESDLKRFSNDRRLMGRLATILVDRHTASTEGQPLQLAERTDQEGDVLRVFKDDSIVVSKKVDETGDETDMKQVDLQCSTNIQAVKIETSSKKSDKETDALDEYCIVALGEPGENDEVMRARYIRVQLTGDDRQLSLAELQAFEGEQNVARGRVARQSSTDLNGHARLAVDGNTNGNFDRSKSVTQTRAGESRPWWEVDLGEERDLDRIVIWNRTDFGRGGWLRRFVVTVLDESRMPVLEQFFVEPPSPSVGIQRPRIAYVTTPKADAVEIALSDDAGPDEESTAPSDTKIQAKSKVLAGDAQNPLRFVRWLTEDGLADVGRFRVSGLRQLDSAETTELRSVATGDASGDLRLAVALGMSGETRRSAEWFIRSLDQAENSTLKKSIVEQLVKFDHLMDDVIQLEPDHSELQLARIRQYTQSGVELYASGDYAAAADKLKSARSLADRLLARVDDSDWQVLEPIKMKSVSGATLDRQADDSILASGKNPKSDTYELSFTGGPSQVKAIRIEVLPDPSFVREGPGRAYDNGNFHLNEIRVSVNDRTIPLASIVGTFEEYDEASSAIDGNPTGAWWGINSRQGKRNWAVIKTDIDRKPTEAIDIGLIMSDGGYDYHSIGRFRISAADDLRGLDHAELISLLDEDEMLNLDLALGRAHAKNGEPQLAAKAFGAALDQVDSIEQRNTVLSELTKFGPSLSELASLRPQDLDIQFAAAGGATDRARDELANERYQQAMTDLQQADSTYKDFRKRENWKVLRPTELRSKSGVELSVLPDNSVLSAAAVPEGDVYTIVYDSLPESLAGLRLETLPDPSLPDRGSGWAPVGGNFGIEELGVFLENQDGDRVAVRLERPTVSRDGRLNPLQMLDGRLNTHWAVWPDHATRQDVIFQVAKPTVDLQSSKLVIELASGHDNRWQIGRFRISAIAEDDGLEVARMLQANRRNGRGDVPSEIALSIAKSYIGLGDEQRAAIALAEAFDAASSREDRVRILESIESPELVAQVEKLKSDDAHWFAARYRSQRAAGEESLAEQSRLKAEELYEQQLKTDGGNAEIVPDIVRLQYEPADGIWRLPEPTAFESELGADLRLLDQGRILASGENPPTDTYRVDYVTDLESVAAIKLEALTHGSLPASGPGRGKNGGFRLSKWSVEHRPRNADDASFVSVEMDDITVDHNMGSEELTVNDWNIFPKMSEDHYAVFELKEPIEHAGGATVRIRMTFHPDVQWSKQNLGCFRVSFSDDPVAFGSARAETAFLGEGVSPMTDLAVAYWIGGKKDRAIEALSLAMEQSKGMADPTAVFDRLDEYPKLRKAIVAQASHQDDLRNALAHQRALILIDEGKGQDAVDVISEALESQPENVTLIELKAKANGELRKWTDVASDYATIASLLPSQQRKKAVRDQANALLRAGQYRQSASLLNRPMMLNGNLDLTRDAFAAHLLSGDRQSAANAARFIAERAKASNKAYWGVQNAKIAVALPDLVTKENREQFVKDAEKSSEWGEPLKAALEYRLGNLENAEPLLEVKDGKPTIQALSVLLLLDQGKPLEAARAEKKVAEWIAEQSQSVVDPKTTPERIAQFAIVRALYDEALERHQSHPRISELSQKLSDDPSDVPSLLERAWLLSFERRENLVKRDREAAESNAQQLQESVAADSDNPSVHAAIGEMAFLEERWQDALASFNRSVELGLDSTWGLFRRAETYALLDDWEAAESDWQLAFEKEPDAARQRLRRIELANEKEEWDVVAVDISERLERLPTNRAGWADRARLLQRTLRESPQVFDSLKKLRTDDTLIEIIRARDLALKSEWADAAQAYAAGIVGSDNIEESYEQAAALLMVGLRDEYLEIVAKLGDGIDERSKNMDRFVSARTACLAIEPGIPTGKVLQWAQQAREEDDQAWLRHVLGLAHWRNGDLDLAIKWFNQSDAQNWHPELNQLGLCLAHAGKGDLETAQSHLREVEAWIAETQSQRDQGEMRDSATDWLELNVLLGEAEAQLELATAPPNGDPNEAGPEQIDSDQADSAQASAGQINRNGPSEAGGPQQGREGEGL